MRWIMVLILLVSCHKKELPPVKDPKYPVRVVQVELKRVPLFIESLGHVDSIDAIAIRSRVEGELVGVHFLQGQEVKKGDLLFTIDPRLFAAELEMAKGALQQSLAELTLAEEKVKRYKPLAEKEFYSQIDYETLQCNWVEAQGLVQENQGRVDRAQVNLDYCWIYAPIDGISGIQQIDLGNLVSADGSTPLVTLNQIAPIFVTFSIPEAKLPQLQRSSGRQVQVAYESFQEEVFEGRLFLIDNEVDEKTGMIKLRAIFDNTARELWPGQFVRTRLILSVVEKGVVIPTTAIQLTEKGPIAFVVRGDVVEQRSLILGQRADDQVLVLKGLEGGETIVVEGQLNLYQDAKIEIRP